jgi:A/G-specific adenine glycosylase
MSHELRKERAVGAIAGPDPATLRRLLGNWYRRQHRKLPWRKTADPYRIWVSEIMLQQTQVAAATPFYQRFIERFPTLAELAASREADCLAVWSGLGYYRRARALRQAARLVVREHGGRVPRDPEQFARLPGVGRYTTGAVLSIAFGAPLAALDGNAARVLARLFALELSIKNAREARSLWDLAARLVPARNPGQWNQALMELGATICVPRSPRCDECPLRSRCEARRLGIAERLPPAAPRRPSVVMRRAAALISRGGRFLVVRRVRHEGRAPVAGGAAPTRNRAPTGGGAPTLGRSGSLLEGLWEPPLVDLDPREPARARLEAELARLGIAATLSPARRIVRHRITHRDIRVELWRGKLIGPPPRASTIRFVDASDGRVALTGFARRALRK